MLKVTKPQKQTAPEAKSEPAQQPAKVIAELVIVPIDNISVIEQSRKRFDRSALEELAQNIKACGVINPLTLRPNGEGGKFQLVAGERRYRAARIAGLSEVPARVLELNDSQALEYQASENIHRKDLTPIEEARAFKTLLDAGKHDVQSLAEVVDKSEAYVYRAIHLLELPAKAIIMIEEGELTPAHGHQLLRVPDQDREEYFKGWVAGLYDGQIPTVQDLREDIDTQVGTDLGAAKFPKVVSYASAAPCTNCPHNSGNQGMLFDGAEKGRCMKASCFDAKTKQYWADVVAELEEAGAHVLISPHSLYPGQYIAGHVVQKELTRDRIKNGQTIALSKGSGKIYSVTLKKETAKSRTHDESHDYEQERIVHEAAQKAEFMALAKKAMTTKFGHNDLVDIVRKLSDNWPYWSEIIGEAWGIKKFDAATLSKMTDSQLIGLSAMMAREADGMIERLGIDTKEIRDEARKKALEDYKAKKKGSK